MALDRPANRKDWSNRADLLHNYYLAEIDGDFDADDKGFNKLYQSFLYFTGHTVIIHKQIQRLEKLL